MNSLRRLAVGFFAISVLQGCSSVTAKRVRPDDYTTPGLRYFAPAPYLIVRTPIELARSEKLYQYQRGASTLTALEDLPKASTTTLPAPVVNVPPPPPGGGNIINLPTAAKPATPKATAAPAKATDTAAGDALKAGATPAADKTNETAKADNKKAEATVSSPEAPEPLIPTAPKDAFDVVWLPDYCQQFAIRQKNVLAKQKVDYTFDNGWQLTKLTTDLDSTDVINKLIDFAGTTVGAIKDLKLEKIKAAEAAAKAPDTPEVKQAGGQIMLRRTEIKYLKPGVYALLVQSDCSKAATFKSPEFGVETNVVWTELAPVE